VQTPITGRTNFITLPKGSVAMKKHSRFASNGMPQIYKRHMLDEAASASSGGGGLGRDGSGVDLQPKHMTFRGEHPSTQLSRKFKIKKNFKRDFLMNETSEPDLAKRGSFKNLYDAPPFQVILTDEPHFSLRSGSIQYNGRTDRSTRFKQSLIT